ncbi:MAG: DeoR/GlpR family DNA-binding transcription regulator [Planctomycetes bacterium]|nr:DeoR/GlpR family DNA-binding transcription regulator [Planctomycetota bacterium]
MSTLNKREQRLNLITTHLKQNNVLSVRELSDISGVSTMTIRRDLEELHKRDVVKFIHGGAFYNGIRDDLADDPPGYLLSEQKMLNRSEKMRIARKAVDLLEPRETCMIDTGTTLFYLAREIPDDLPVTAICWSLNIISELIKKPQCTLISLGGVYHHETQMFESMQGMDLIKNTRASKAFISAGGVHPQLGVTCPFHYETETKRVAINSSMSKVLLVDSSKFGKVCTSHLAEVSDFDMLITDSGISDDYRRSVEDAGVELVVV